MKNWWNNNQPVETVSNTRSMEERLRALEQEMDDAKREVARLQVELAATTERANNYVQLVEQRISLIYQQVVQELHRAFNLGTIGASHASTVEQELARLVSSGFATDIDPASLSMRTIMSDRLEPGALRGPLTLYGFRVDRERARDLGNAIEVLPNTSAGSGSVLYGPYKRLQVGRYAISLDVALGRDQSDVTGDIAIDVYSPSLDRVFGDMSLQVTTLRGRNQRLSVSFDWGADAAKGSIEMRVHQRSSALLLLSDLHLDRMDGTAG
jgi:hypothetical protein